MNSPVRAFGGVDITPLFIERASGSKIYDIDGNEYIDYVGSWGPMILGHAHPKILEAIEAAARNGTSFGAPTLAETALAEKIVAAFDSIEKVRLVSSGTEAVMTAIRLARAYTKRDLIIKMAGCYHGHSDSLLVAAGSGVAERGIASSAGVPGSLARLTIVVPCNDIDAAKAAFAKHADEIAAVLVEPVAANMGVVPPADGYLQTLRNLCDESGALLIFDEVITGFRVAYGGAQELYGISADITCLGKIIGGGLPMGAFGARADIMDMLSPTGPVYQAGTLSGNPLATAAANATLDLLRSPSPVTRDPACLTAENAENAERKIETKNSARRPDSSRKTRGQAVSADSAVSTRPAYQYLESIASTLQAGLADVAKQARVHVTINRVGSIMSCFFTAQPVRNFADVQSTNIGQFKQFFAHTLNQGIYLAPSAYEAMFVSLAHTKVDIEKTIEAAGKSFREIKGTL